MSDRSDERRHHGASDRDDGGGRGSAHALLRATRLTCGLGITFAVLFVVALLSFTQAPTMGASDAELVAYYVGADQRLLQLAGLYLLPLAAVAFLWFIAALREWVICGARPIDHVMSTVQMLSGVGFITLAFAAAGAATIVSLSSDQSALPIDATLARQFPLYGRTLLMVFGMRMAAMFVMSTAKIGHGAGLYPQWFVVGSVVVAAALFLVATLNVWLILVFPLWVLVLSAVIWQRSAQLQHALASRTPRESRAQA
jgi:hypothetical protein